MAPKDDPTVSLLKALAVTAEITGTELSEAAARVMASELLVYPHEQVIVALDRCRRELKARLTLAAILERLDDGRPGPNEAWAMIPQDEAGSVVWTDEMSHAFGIAQPLIAAGQMVQASMTFREVYAEAIARARADRIPPRWTPSLGHDKRTRAAAIETAVRMGRITQEHAAKLLPAPESATVTALLEAPRSNMPAEVRKQLAAFTAKLRAKP
jgi:hypothetical protein